MSRERFVRTHCDRFDLRSNLVASGEPFSLKSKSSRRAQSLPPREQRLACGFAAAFLLKCPKHVQRFEFLALNQFEQAIRPGIMTGLRISRYSLDQGVPRV